MRIFIAVVLIGVAAPALAQTPVAKPAAEKKICKAEAETGSLVKKRKQCFTSSEWARLAESQQTGARKLIDDLQSRQSGN